jgi:alpha-L-rhamnosidase
MKKIIIISLFFIQNLFGQIKTDWQANWIGIAEKSPANSWICFRKDTVLKLSKNQKVTAHIACDSKYWLYVNGKMVIFEGQIKRGPTPNDSYFDEVEIGKYLKNGKNTIAVLVWYFGKDGFSHKNSGKAGLLFEADLGKTKLISDATWQGQIHPAYGNTQKPFPNYRLPESNIRFDAQKDIENWFLPSFKNNLPNVISFGKAPTNPWGSLHKRPIPQWENSGLLNYTKIEREIKNDTLTIKAYLPQNLMITHYFEVESEAGRLIDIRSDNYRGGGEPNVRTEYITKKGKHQFESFAFTNGHYVIYKMPSDVKIISLKYRETRFDTKLIGSFTSSDSALNILHQKALNTLQIGIRDHIHDCPDRERALWWGDVVITMGELFYVADNQSHLAIKKAIHELVDWQKADSALYSPVPAGNWKNELPGQMLASIGKLGFWKYYENTGDKATIEKVYPALKKYLALYKTDENGLVIHREGGWMWHDWGERVDVPVLDNVWYYLALEGTANMAKVLNQTADYEEFANKMKRLKPAFQKAFWTGEGYRSANFPFGYDDRVQGMAVVSGLSEKNQWEAMKKILGNTFQAGAYLEKYILESYFMMNDAEAGFERMKNRYQKMIESKHTTLWEGWDIGSAKYGGGTYNHGWTGGPLTLMHEYVAGVKSTSNDEVIIAPQPANLKFYKTVSHTKQGLIKQEYKSDNQKVRLSLNLENNLFGKIYFPKINNKKYRQITINGIVKMPTNETENGCLFEIRTGKTLIVGEF